jgi:hypothetical protein
VKLNTSQLKQTFSIIDNVPNSSSLETTQIVRLQFKSKKLSMTLSGRLRASTSQPVDEAIKDTMLFVDRRFLGSFLSGAGKAITLTISSDAVVLRSVGHRLQLQRRQAGVTDYETWDAIKAKKLTLDEGLVKLARQLSVFTSEAPGSLYMQAISLKKGYGVYASDGVTLAAALTADVNRTVLLPVDVPAQLGKGSALMLDDLGAGVIFAEQEGVTGLLYQAMPEDCKKRYPTSQLEEFINMGAKAKPVLTFEFKDLDVACSNLGTFQFAVVGVPLVNVSPIPKDKVHVQFSLPLTSGVSEFKVRCKVAKQFTASKWPFVTLATWLQQLNSVDATVSYAQIPSAHVFSAEVDSVKRLLICSNISDTEVTVSADTADAETETDVVADVEDDDVPF